MKLKVLSLIAIITACVAAPAVGQTKLNKQSAVGDTQKKTTAKPFGEPRETGKGIVDFKVKVKGYPKDTLVLGYYFDDRMLVKDSVITDAKGVAHFKSDTLFAEGLYLLHFPHTGGVMDIIMPHEQKFFLECDTLPQGALRAKVQGSRVIANFLDYQKFIIEKQMEFKKLNEEFMKARQSGDVAKQNEIRQEFMKTDSIVNKRNDETIAANKDNFLSTFLHALKEVDVPEFTFPETMTQQELDSARQVRSYYYYRAHFYDNFDMTDDRLLRTPFFVKKINKFFDESVPQVADSVAAEAIKLIEMCRPNRDMFRFFVSTMYNRVNQSNIMGMDAALVKIADRYYLSGEADWAEDKFIEDLRENVNGIRHTLIGMKAPDMKMPSLTGEWFKLSEVKAPYTVLAFWEPSCGHCKKEIPHLKTAIYDKFAKYGVKIFAVYVQMEEEPWKEFIEEHQLEDFINVYDPYGRSRYRQYYHIKSTPTLFVLDKDKTIVAKKLGVDQIADFLTHMLGLDNQPK